MLTELLLVGVLYGHPELGFRLLTLAVVISGAVVGYRMWAFYPSTSSVTRTSKLRSHLMP